MKSNLIIFKLILPSYLLNLKFKIRYEIRL